MTKHRNPELIESNECCACGNKAKYVTAGGRFICESSVNKCPLQRKKNSDGVKKRHEEVFEKTGKKGFYDYDSLSDESKDRMNWNKDNFSADFSLNGRGNHKQVLIIERGHICECCGLSEWFGSKIVLELEHSDGNNKNNVKDNLKLLCPNCHSLTPTWRGRNINTGKIKVSDAELIDALSKSNNIRQALIKVNLTPKAGNYARCNDLIFGGLVKLANTSDLNSDASA